MEILQEKQALSFLTSPLKSEEIHPKPPSFDEQVMVLLNCLANNKNKKAQQLAHTWGMAFE